MVARPAKHRKPIPVGAARDILVRSANNAITAYMRWQAISSEHPYSADVYVYDWPTTEEPPADGVTAMEVRLSASERRGDTPRTGLCALAWHFADGRTVDVFSCEVRGNDDPAVSLLPSEEEMVRASVTCSWLLGDASRYREEA